MKKISFDEALYNKCKKELNSRRVREIILRYRNSKTIIKYEPEFLSYYYSPTLTALIQFFGNLKGKDILEIGYRMPLFLRYLEMKGANAYGIDVKPELTTKRFRRMSVENVRLNKKFDAVIARITLSKLYNENYLRETGKPRFSDPEMILKNISKILKPGGILVLQDDRGTIFRKGQFKDLGFKKIMREKVVRFRDKNKKNIGWNVLVVYQKL